MSVVPPRKPYDQLRTRLLEALLAMASHAEEALANAMRALDGRDDVLAEQVIGDDAILDHYELEIDDLCVQLLAMAPMARELRLITVAMKISRNLERIGDEAVRIARSVAPLLREAPARGHADLPHLSTGARQMLSEAIGAFVDGRPDRARDLLPRDRAIDDCNRRLQHELAERMTRQPAEISRHLQVMAVAKALERIADHATNIAEDVVFLCEGKDIRHASAA
jgi:phosphate transport system protein